MNTQQITPTTFYCYSTTLHDFFDANEIPTIDNKKRYHPKTKQQYWTYRSSNIITKLLEEYKSQKPNN